jgi:tetratricopeptide (TPR) repeat protein
MKEKNNSGTARLRRFLRAILFAGSAIAAGWAATTQAQSVNFSAAPGVRSGMKVSMRELRIPAKARDEFNRGLRSLEKRDVAKSLRHFDAALRVFPEYYEVYYHEGIAALIERNNEEALRCFQKAIDVSDSEYSPAEFGYGLALMREGKLEEAERVVRHGLESDSYNPDGHVVLGFVLLKLKRLDEAEKSAHQALDLNAPNSAKGYLVLSDLNGERGNYEDSARDLDTYLKLRPNDPNKSTLRAVRDLAKRLAARSRLTASN